MSRYIGNFVGVPSTEPAQASAPGIWSLSDQLAYQRANLWPPARDPYYNQTVLHLSGNVPNISGPQAMNLPLAYNSDASSNNFLVTPNGDVSPRPFSPYFGGNYSNYLDGNGDYLTVPSSTAFNFGTGDFTVECWIYQLSRTAGEYDVVWTLNGPGVTGTVPFSSGMYLSLGAAGGSFLVANSSENGWSVNITVPLPTLFSWEHYAVTRSGNTWTVYKNGQPVGSANSSAGVINSRAPFSIGAQGTQGDNYFDGYISNFRVVKGTAVYMTNFTPPTQPFQNITNTSLLTCQSNRFLDNSSNGFTVTRNGDVRVTDNSPFVTTDWTTGSAYFDGNGDWLAAASNAAFGFGSSLNDFTVQGWFYVPSAVTGNARGIFHIATSINGVVTGYGVGITNTQILQYYAAGTFNNSTTTVTPGQWYFLTMVRSAGMVSVYLNGSLVQNGSVGDSQNFATAELTIGVWFEKSSTFAFPGYISDFRVVKGSALAATIPTAPLLPITNTSLLTLQTRAASQNSAFIDSSPNEFIVTKNGNTTQGTFSPFSPTGWGNRFDGSSGKLAFPTGSFVFGNSDFTIEAWVYNTGTTTGAFFTNQYTSGASTTSIIGAIGSTNGNFDMYIGGSVYSLTGINPTSNQWVHVAIVRTGGTVSVFQGGNRTHTRSDLSTLSINAGGTSVPPQIGDGVNGFLSNHRVIIGSGPYDATLTSITVPTAPLTVTANTKLLTCQSNRFLDQTGKTITVTGTPSVQAFSPFAPATQSSPLVTGGSGYFPSSATLTIPSAPALNMTGDFCMEGWAYPTAAGFTFAWKYTGGNVGASEYWWVIDGTNQLSIALDGGGGEDYFRTAANTITLNAWNHCVLTRVGNEVRQFINGVLRSYNTTSRTLNVTSTTFQTNGTLGYTSGFRIMKGSIPDAYRTTATTTGTAVFNPPTTPPTPTQNTSLLLNFTAGGIVDATGKNNLETVANAQVSTVQAKWPPGSMYFNGSTGKAVGPSSPNLNMGSGDFTVECWVYWAGGSLPYQNFVGSNSTSFTGNATFFRVWGTSATLGLANKVGIGNPTHDSTSSVYSVNSLTANTWTHVAATRSSGIIRLFINGTLERTGSSDTSTYDFGNNGICVGQSPWDGANGWYGGYIDDLRITKGYARYTASFTPPTGPFAIG